MKAARSTTILSVRRDGLTALGGDGQVTLGNIVAKHDAIKIRRIGGGKVLTGFAGSAADAFALLERFEKKLSEFPDNTRRAVIELNKHENILRPRVTVVISPTIAVRVLARRESARGRP